MDIKYDKKSVGTWKYPDLDLYHDQIVFSPIAIPLNYLFDLVS